MEFLRIQPFHNVNIETDQILNYGIYFLRLEIAIKITPITATAMPGAGLSLSSPDKNIHMAIATQANPIINCIFSTRWSLIPVFQTR